MASVTPISAAVISHIGCERSNNEDNFFFNGDFMPMDSMDKGALISEVFHDKVQLYAVCDGMGGAQFGERASSITVRKMASLLLALDRGKPDTLVEAFCREASQEVYRDGAMRQAKYQGTTLAMVVLKKDTAYVYNVGDSRVYLFRGGSLEQLSKDHSEVYRMYLSGQLTKEQARVHPRSNVITRFIGMGEDKQADFVYKNKLSLQKGDRLMLLSDGISDLMGDVALARACEEGKSPLDLVKNLAQAALELSGKDNLTAMVVDI